MIEILLFGVLVVAVYVIAHVVTLQVERWHGQPLGVWRSVTFFCVFLGLLLIAMQVATLVAGGGTA